MLAEGRARLRLRALAEARAGELAGAYGYLGLMRLPVDARVVRVNARVVGREDAVLLVVLEEEGPGQRYHGRYGREADYEPVYPHAYHEHHDGEDEEVHQRAAEVARYHDDDAEHQYEVQRELRDGGEAVQLAAGLEVDHVLGHDDYEGQLDYLRGLDAYAAQAQPGLVARGLVALSGEDEQEEERRARGVQPLPVVGEDVKVDDGYDDVAADAEGYAYELYYNVARGVICVERGAPDGYESVGGADKAQRQQEHIRAAEEIPDLRQELFRSCHLAL